MNTDAVDTYTQLAAIVRSLGGQLGGVQAGAKQAELSHAQALLQNRAMPHNQQHNEGHTLAQVQALQVRPRSRDWSAHRVRGKTRSSPPPSSPMHPLYHLH